VVQVSLKGAEPMQVKIVEREGFQIVGFKQEFSLVNEENLVGIPKIWDKINGEGTDERLFKLNNGPVEGVVGVCVEIDSGSIDYWIGSANEGSAPNGLSTWQIPESKWAVVEVHGPLPDAMQKAWKQIFSEV